MYTLFRKLTIVWYERESLQKKLKFVGEKDNNWHILLQEKDNILNLLEI